MTLSLPRFAGIAAATTGAVCAAALAVAGGSAGAVEAVAAAGALAWIAGVLGYVPVALRVLGESAEGRAQAWMIGLGIRLFLTLGVLLAVWTTGALASRVVFVVTTGALYLALLAVETLLLARSMRRPGPNGSPSA